MIWLSKRRSIFLMLFPTLLLFTGYILIPILISFYYSTTKYTGIGIAEFVGLNNYKLLLGDSFFWVSLKNTFIILGVSLILLVPLSFLLALLLNRSFKGSGALKALNYTPSIIAPIVVGLIWVFVLDPQMGLINMLLTKLGLGNLTQMWIGGKALAPYSIGVVFVWQQLGFIATIFLAGLKMIPRDVYESSAIDGAGSWQQLRHITVPMMNETNKIAVVLVITNVFKIFETVFMLTGGGPNHQSEVLVTYMYNTTFTSAEYGYGMAISTVTFLLTVLFSVAYLKLSQSNIED
ncbi:carbohydrate ABC transporter permease [Paenibacillus phocaensis]|uniref:carbohydrate ABC transporter permease n=1 Tax=Paenibacillus phocaensis TaxID=1776378 RepID=UPI000839D3FE|nr:sugar ABC transporter permease [Paenibacillus phocaensis]